MNRTDEYIKSFGDITEEQKEHVKNTFFYQRCALADAIDNLIKEVRVEALNLMEKIGRWFIK